MERLVILTDSSIPDFKSFYPWEPQLTTRKYENRVQETENNYITVKPGTVDEMVNSIIVQLYDKVEGNKSELAKHLGVSRTTLYKKLKELSYIT